MNRLDESLDECAALTESTREEVSKDCMISFPSSLFNNRYLLLQISVTQQKADTISGNFKSVHVAVRVLVNQLLE